MFILGAAILLLIPAKTYSSLVAVVVLFSVADGLMVSTFIIELFKSVMESQRASSLGFCMLIGCVSVFCGPPVSGEYFIPLSVKIRTSLFNTINNTRDRYC